MVRVKAQIFLKDGPEVTWTKGDARVTTGSRLDTPDHMVDVGFQISALDYQLMFETAALKDMKKGDVITVNDDRVPANSGRYSVNDIGPLWDGVFSRAMLRKL